MEDVGKDINMEILERAVFHFVEVVHAVVVTVYTRLGRGCAGKYNMCRSLCVEDLVSLRNYEHMLFTYLLTFVLTQ